MNFVSKIRQLNSISRAGDWRLSFIPFIIGCVYLWLFYFDIAFTKDALLLFLLSIVTSFGFATLGYFINEFFDKASDQKAGKLNKLAFLKPQYQFLIFIAVVSITMLPWLKLPTNQLSWALIITELLLFILYSFPFPRLKEVPLISNVIDAAYAYVLPLVLAFHTYGLYAGKSLDSLILIFAVPVFFIGFRNILIHQVNDVFKDRRSGINTLPRVLGVNGSSRLLKILLLLEFAGILVFSILLSRFHPIFWWWTVFYGIYFVYQSLKQLPAFFTTYFPIDKARHLSDALYQIWFPLFTLTLLIIRIDIFWFLAAPLHALLLIPKKFYVGLSSKFFLTVSLTQYIYYNYFLWVWCKFKTLVNVIIYKSFLLFGVDLIKEDKSAIQYLKGRLVK